MELTSGRSISVANSDQQSNTQRRNYSIFEVPSNVFDSCRFFELLSTPEITATTTATTTEDPVVEIEASEEKNAISSDRRTCNICKYSFDSLHDQRSHFKSDFHLLNVKLSIAGKYTVKEDDFDEWTFNSLVKDYDIISSISGSEGEDNKEFGSQSDLTRGLLEINKQKICISLPNGETISFWKCLLLCDSEKFTFKHDLSGSMKDDDMHMPCVTVRELSGRLLNVIHEPRNSTHLRIILLVSGGHFAGCVFDGNSVIAHKTLNRYVIRAKAGKKQSSEDAGGKIAHSAGASIRRHNELALKKAELHKRHHSITVFTVEVLKLFLSLRFSALQNRLCRDIRELLTAWKPYFDLSTCIFIHAPSHNWKLLLDGQNPCFICQTSVIRHIPLTVGRPTFKEAQRLYKILTQISTEPDKDIVPTIKEDLKSTLGKENLGNDFGYRNISEDCFVKNVEKLHMSLPLHEAAKAGNVEKVLELLEQGFDPCVIDERGRTPYRLASEKEVRNTFRRFMALNPNKWDWQAAKVPCPLTKEMEEAQNAKQATKDAKRKTRAKELKLLRKAREKKAQEGDPCSNDGTHWIPSMIAGALVLVIGSLMVVAFGQMSRGRTRKNAR